MTAPINWPGLAAIYADETMCFITNYNLIGLGDIAFITNYGLTTDIAYIEQVGINAAD